MSRLEENSVQYRKKEIARNSYDSNDEYSVSHPNALSDGDEKGKGEKNKSVGGATDIKERNEQIARNRYNKNREYNDSTA